jgi:8-oxo-dGTP diphosphatase
MKTLLPVGVSVLCVNGDLILLGRRNANIPAGGILSTPGGRVEQDENIFQAAARELYEETGLRADLEVLAVREKFAYGAHLIMFYFRATNITGTLETKEPDKCDGWHWFDYDVECTEPCDIRIGAVHRRYTVSPIGVIDER